MKSNKKLSKRKLGTIIIALLLIFLNLIIIMLFSSKTLTLTTYKYIFMSYNSIIIITALLLKKKVGHIYRTLTIIMVGIFNLLDSIMQIDTIKIGISTVLQFALFLSIILIFAFASQCDKN